MTARTAVETIQAAIEKLEALKATTLPGPWELEPMAENFNPRWDVARILYAKQRPDDEYRDRYIHVDDSYGMDPAGFRLPEAQLIVTLHRTIDSQLAILRHTLARTEAKIAHGGGPEPVWSNEFDALTLARSILGES